MPSSSSSSTASSSTSSPIPSPTPSATPSSRASVSDPESGSPRLKRKLTPKEFTDFIQSQWSKIASSVDWGMDKESGVSAVNSLIDFTSGFKKKVQSAVGGSEASSKEKESLPPSPTSSTASQASSQPSSTPSKSSQDSDKPPWERQSKPKAPLSAPPSATSTSSSTPSTSNMLNTRSSSSPLSSTPSANKASSKPSSPAPADDYRPTPVTELATSVEALRGDGDRAGWPKGKGRLTPEQIEAYEKTAEQRLKAKLQRQAKANAKGEIGADCC